MVWLEIGAASADHSAVSCVLCEDRGRLCAALYSILYSKKSEMILRDHFAFFLLVCVPPSSLVLPPHCASNPSP